ncbi:MAG: hypothetical protein GXP26_12635 [Planctomycetes bacterium]|nr:hypothetical protein [Planctomycetota bacterium]
MQTDFPKTDAQGWRPALTLLAATLIIAGMWGVVLPRIADLPTMQQKIQHLERKGIDPNAFFYSDHPAAFNNSN